MPVGEVLIPSKFIILIGQLLLGVVITTTCVINFLHHFFSKHQNILAGLNIDDETES